MQQYNAPYQTRNAPYQTIRQGLRSKGEAFKKLLGCKMDLTRPQVSNPPRTEVKGLRSKAKL